jgi:head-tail adaptor
MREVAAASISLSALHEANLRAAWVRINVKDVPRDCRVIHVLCRFLAIKKYPPPNMAGGH